MNEILGYFKELYKDYPNTFRVAAVFGILTLFFMIMPFMRFLLIVLLTCLGGLIGLSLDRKEAVKGIFQRLFKKNDGE